jgi:undecaprenyl-diphosphatase
MEIFKIIFLGIVQGLTEFLPISSSGHLVIFQNLLKLESPAMTVDIFLHTGTLLAVIIVFWEDIVKILLGFIKSLNFKSKDENPYGKLAWLIVLANIPAGVVGVLFKDQLEHIFMSNRFVYFFLIFTGAYLYLSKFCKEEKADIKNVGIGRSIIIGISQMFAILPGISRSGMTITTGMLTKLKREDAARFSFFIMLPAVAGATLLEIKDMNPGAINIFELLAGVLAAFISGYIAIKILLKLIRDYKLHYFSYYCVILGILGLLFL